MELSSKSLSKYVIQGAGIAFVLGAIFLSVMFSIGDVLARKNLRQTAWEFLPLITITIGGALASIIYYLIVEVWRTTGWKKNAATMFSVLVYMLLLWISLVIGFSITGQWD